MKRKPLLSFTLATLAATALLVFVPLAQAQAAAAAAPASPPTLTAQR